MPFSFLRSPLLAALLGGSLLLFLPGCDEETLGPQTRGSIQGVVQDADPNAPIDQANVTTSPPTQSVLTSDSGTFSLPDIPTGNYSVEATKTGYDARAVQVSVQENQTAGATLLLERGDDFGEPSDSLTVEVTNWFNDRINRDSTGADSIFADVEYSARNVGDVRIQAYEVYFEIETGQGVFSREVGGDSLASGHRDLGGFRRLVQAEATAVRVADVYWEASAD
jgi:hypothetical protein